MEHSACGRSPSAAHEPPGSSVSPARRDTVEPEWSAHGPHRHSSYRKRSRGRTAPGAIAGQPVFRTGAHQSITTSTRNLSARRAWPARANRCGFAGVGLRCLRRFDAATDSRGAADWMIFTDGCPGGETPSQVGERVDRVIARARAATGNVALFAHGHVLRVFAARWLGLPPASGSHFMLSTATVSVLGNYHGSAAIKRWNAPLMSKGPQV